jgi:hypothetical protein
MSWSAIAQQRSRLASSAVAPAATTRATAAVTINRPGTVIGMSEIKLRRLKELQLMSHPNLFVGQCVPFYFCTRSVMLYLIYQANHEDLRYRGGQAPIIHLEGDLRKAVAWAEQERHRWAFTLSNAGAYGYEDRCDLKQLEDLDWDAVAAEKWSGWSVSPSIKKGKQAEFLVEHCFPWHLVERIGVHSQSVVQQVAKVLQGAEHRPAVEVRADWYY